MISPEDLMRWQSLKAFEAKWNQFVQERPIGRPGDVWASHNSHAFREGFVAIRVARIIGARSIRINPRDSKAPDIDIQLRNGGAFSFQESLADCKDRHMVREHRKWVADGNKVMPDPASEWLARRREIGPAISRAIELKASKNYPPTTNLLLYLNLGTYGTWRDEIEADILRFSEPGPNWFRSVWILWEGRLYRAAPNPFLGSPGTFRPKSFVKLGDWRLSPPSIKWLFEDEVG
jgi:hypothetical protein